MELGHIIETYLDPEARANLELSLYGQRARIHQQQAALDADLEYVLTIQGVVDHIKGAIALSVQEAAAESYGEGA